MGNIEISIKINIVETTSSIISDHSAEQMGDGHFRLILDDSSVLDINKLEEGLLRTNYPALRDALAKHLEYEIKKKAMIIQNNCSDTDVVTLHGSPYRVDGEIGRFQFNIYDVTGASGNVIVEGTSWLPPLHAREWYQTFGFKEMSIFFGSTQQSYRNIKDEINRFRHQTVGGTPLNTLRDATEREGCKVIAFMDAKTQIILEKEGFSHNGIPTEICPLVNQNHIHGHASEGAVSAALKLVHKNMRKANMDENMIEEASQLANPSCFEQLHDSVNICVDEVEVKKQKETREKKTKLQTSEGRKSTEYDRECIDDIHNSQLSSGIINLSGEMDKNGMEDPKNFGSSHSDAQTDTHECQPSGCNDNGQGTSSDVAGKLTEKSRQKIQNAVARIEHGGNGITLTGRSVFNVLLYVVAIILNNNIHTKKLLFYVDGQRSLHTSILSLFYWCSGMSIVLDWFHLVERTKKDLSSALKGRHIRNHHLRPILRFLWYGLVDRAIQYVRNIPESDVRDSEVLDRLVGYFERNRSCIPFYALRKQLGLQNSSNRVECQNNLVTSRRQKKSGMSWSKGGSHSLTSLTSVVRNGHVKHWVEKRAIPFQLAKTA